MKSRQAMILLKLLSFSPLCEQYLILHLHTQGHMVWFIYWEGQEGSEEVDIAKCMQISVQDLHLSKYIKEQEKESCDCFLETKAGKWSSEVNICLMNPWDSH